MYGADGSLCQSVQQGLARQPALHAFLRIGLQGKLNGESVTVTGRIRYRMQCEEWDAEDDCYTDEQWDYDEWLLTTNSSTFFLSECQGEMELQMTMPSAPLTSLDWTADTLPTQDGGKARVLVRGIATITFVQGELPWELPDTGRVRVLEYEDGKRRGAVELDIDDEQAPVAEPEYFLGELIESRALQAIFGTQFQPTNSSSNPVNNQIHNARRTVTRAQSSSLRQAGEDDGKTLRQRWVVRYLLAAAVLFVVSIIVNQSGDVVFRETVDASLWGQQKRVGPIALNRPGELYEVEISGRLPYSNGDVGWLGVELETGEDEVVNTVESDMWRDGTESNSSDSKVFRLKEAGTYYLRLDGDPGNYDFPATVTVRAGVTLARYYLAASVCLFILVGLLSRKRDE